MKYRLEIEYDGTGYSGWQIQSGQPTVQGALEDALAIALRKPISVVGSGRTDSGVHARGQIAHFLMEEAVSARRLLHSLNGLLSPSIVVLSLGEVAGDFHARHDARRRRYHYYLSCHPRALDRHCRYVLQMQLDFDRMNQAAEHLLGSHHFGAFCRTRSATRNRVCCVEHACWMGEERSGDWRFEIVADRFLHGMVRAIVGTLLEVGRGNRQPHDIVRILQSKDRREAGPAAPAHGLVLEMVSYD